jgi:hypothetical protein
MEPHNRFQGVQGGMTMKMDEVRRRAKEMGLATDRKAKKTDLIRAIQTAEGNSACFDTGRLDCSEKACCWREDCLGKQAMLAL